MTTAFSSELINLIQEHAAALDPRPTGQDFHTPTLSGIRAVVFDVYGTLIVSGVGDISLAGAGGRSEQIRQALSAYGLEIQDREADLAAAFHETIVALQQKRREEGIDHPEVEIREVWEQFLEEWNTRELLRGELTLKKIEHIAVHYEMAVNPVWPMPGLAKVLESLAQRAIPTGIISNAQFFTPLLFPALTGKSLEAFQVEERCSIWSYREREAKPSTHLYEKAAEKWKACHQISPGEILYIGNDMRNDIWPAHEVGFKTALFAGDLRSLRLREDHPQASRIKPDWIVTDLLQILTALG